MQKNDNSLTISVGDVQSFKTTYCDENPIIKQLLREQFLPYFDEPILDVGGGMGDILSGLIPEKKVVHLDVLEFSEPVPAAHSRVTGSFLDERTVQELLPIQTLFMCHVQQFIDGDLALLKTALARANAKRVVMVEDLNDDTLGEVMRFSLENFPNANPEVKLEGFPYGYQKIKSVPFKATLRSDTFEELATQCLYLMDVEVAKENIAHMSDFLKTRIATPEFTINQEIAVYEKSQA